MIAGTGFLYEYDAAGNLSRVREMVTDSTYRTLAEYSYDSQNQLSYEVRYSYVGNNLTGPSTSLHYFYDTAGNLLKVEENDVEIETYAYGNAKWRDLLTSYNGHNIAYEGQTLSGNTVSGTAVSGNPVTWYNGSGINYTDLYWEQGRRLTAMQFADAQEQYQASFTYDMDGVRTQKNVDGELHKYVTQNGKVVREKVYSGSTLQYTLDFIYDAGGQPFALIRTLPDNTKTTYYYVLNAQGDVVKLINAYGTTYATYRYDAWGRILSATGTLAEVNPLRYRGYYYDTETEWYYLQSRYYDPTLGRFINADSYASTGQGFLGYNMFAYCGNNPISNSDPTGTRMNDPNQRDYGGVVGYTDAGTGTSNCVTVFYNADQNWTSAANQTGLDLCNATGADSYRIVPAETTSFQKSWRNIKSSYILLEVHGGPTLLSTPSSFYVNASQITNLPQNKNIKCVIITACSSGREDPGQTSIARAFSTIIAPDGIVICATRDVMGNGTSFIPKDNGMWIIYQNGCLLPARLHQTMTMDYAAELLP